MKKLFHILDKLFYRNNERLPSPLAALRAFAWRQICGPDPTKIRVNPLMAEIAEVGRGGRRLCVVVPASQMPHVHACTLKLGGFHGEYYGEVLVVGSQRAITKITQVLVALEFDVELQ